MTWGKSGRRRTDRVPSPIDSVPLGTWGVSDAAGVVGVAEEVEAVKALNSAREATCSVGDVSAEPLAPPQDESYCTLAQVALTGLSRTIDRTWALLATRPSNWPEVTGEAVPKESLVHCGVLTANSLYSWTRSDPFDDCRGVRSTLARSTALSASLMTNQCGVGATVSFHWVCQYVESSPSSTSPIGPLTPSPLFSTESAATAVIDDWSIRVY